MSLFSPSLGHIPLVGWNRFSQSSQHEPGHAPATRAILCPHCGEHLRVPSRAINTRCTGCYKHLMLEDVIIRGDSVRNRVITCGTILVEPAARFAGVLQGSEIVIAGRVMGTVIGTQRVEVTATGKVAGTIATRVLQAHEQALIDGEINILNPDNSVSTSPAHR